MNRKIFIIVILVTIMGAVLTGCSTQKEPEKIRYTYTDENGEKVTETLYAVPKDVTIRDRMIPVIFICVFLVFLRRLVPIEHLCYKFGINEPNGFWQYYNFYDLEVKGIFSFLPDLVLVFAIICACTEPVKFLVYPVLIIFCIATTVIDTIFFWRLGKRLNQSVKNRIKIVLLPPLYLWRIVRDEMNVY